MPITLQDVQAHRPLVQNLFMGAKPGKMAMIARKLLPEVNAELSGSVFGLKPEDVLRLYEDTTDDGVAEMYDFTPDLLTYDQRIRALKVNMTRRARQGAQGPLKNLMGTLTSAMRLGLDLKYEQRVATKLNDTAVFSNAAATAPIGSPGDAPVQDLLARGDAVRLALGHYPNTVVYSADVFKRAAASEAMQKFIASFRGNGADFGAFTPAQLGSALALAWGMDEPVAVLVGGAVGNTSRKGVAKNMVNLWPSGRIIVGYFERPLPQFSTRTDNLPVGAPAEVAEAVTTPLVALMGPDHGTVNVFEAQESKDVYVRYEYDYDLMVSTPEANSIITGS